MIRYSLLLIILFYVLKGQGQQPDFAIIGQDDEVIEEITIISGVSLQLRTNFEEVVGEPVIIEVNDRFVGPFHIGFSFYFYGDQYSDFHIGANGYLSFEQMPFAPIRLAINIPTPSGGTKTIANCILGPLKPWEYEKSTNTSFIKINRLGSQPNRKLIVTWCEIPPQISNPNEVTGNGSFQIVLNELDRSIENHLISIPDSDYGGNHATQGLMNKDADRATVVLNRNNNSWTAANESWRFNWDGNDYQVKSIDYEPFAVAENIYWYELEGATGRNLISDQQQVSVTPRTNTRYLAEITSCWGDLIASAELSVIVEGVFPNAFNPNSNVVANQTFKMPSIPDAVVANYLLQIYNRWGQLVFETNNISTGWNGRMQNTGQECPAGVYHWVMMREDNGKTPVTNSGAVMLLR